MRLVEFQGDSSRLPLNVVTALKSKIGKMQRVGGNKRIYEVGDDHLGIVYLLGNTTKAIGVAWSRSTGAIGVDTIYVWNQFDITRQPDAELDLPVTGSFNEMLKDIVAWIVKPTTGEQEVSEDIEIDEMASRTTASDFMSMAQAKFGEKAASLTLPEMMALAQENDVQIPGDIRTGSQFKVDAHHWNLLGRRPNDNNDQMSKQLGSPIEEPEDVATMDPAYQDVLDLAKAKTVRKMAAAGKLHLFGRKPNGAFWKVPGLETISAQLERMLSRQLQDMGGDGKRESMEEQYDMLHDKVKLVAGGESNFIKSLLITGAPSSGKALALDTPIPTPSGWTTMGELKVGDTLYDENGNHCKVTFATPIQLNRSCYEVEFEDGTIVVADEEHRWLTSTVASRQSNFRSRKTEEIKQKGTDQRHKRILPRVVSTLEIYNSLTSCGKVNHRISNTKPIVGNDQKMPINPYILGMWLGDGCSHVATLSCGKTDHEQVKSVLEAENQPFKSTLTNRGVWHIQLSDGQGGKYETKLRTKLRKLDLIKNKHIPDIYLRSSVENRIALLQGLMDTDGSIDKNGNCEFSSSNERIAEGFHEILLSLGIKSTKKTGKSTLYGVEKKTRYRFIFKTSQPIFRFKRKLNRIQCNYRRKSTTESRSISSVRPVDSVPVRCITVDSPNSLFLCSRSFIPTHNTFTVMKTIKELGLSEGKDYVVKKGRISTNALYRTLIEQIDGMVLFDDCDSVVEDKNAVNMLKGALDTDPIREISYDVKGTLNTAVMDPEHRDEFVSKISRILRGKPIEGDLESFERYLKFDDDEFDDIEVPDDEEFSDGEGKYHFSHNQLAKTQQYLTAHLPNKIDFKGRIIFISNMAEDEWDGAILTRAFAINMDFSSSEMLDYIEKIKGHIKTPGLSDEMKQEVMDYLRELYTVGKLKRQVNFRLVQQCFDLRLTDNWKKMMSMM